ncbi:MAG: hypothetical protein LBE59_06210 [Nevskiaceae bacterium]|jgi:hypothetical protein|nr:hypothetical protein [Nevskiaceae bacterium]
MKTIIRVATGIAAGLLLAALPVAAHHSTAMFDFTKTVTLEGTIKDFQWTNPHTWTTVTVAGKEAGEYGLEGMSPNYLAREGWSKRTLKPGDKVKLDVYPLKDGRKGGFMLSVTLPDGTLLYSLPRRAGSPAAAAREAAAQ